MILRVYDVECTDVFVSWWSALPEPHREAVTRGVDRLELYGTSLGHPYSSKLKASRHRRMRELRILSSGRPFRVFYAFDSRRIALVLLGGDKTGDNRFYERLIPQADRLYDIHIATLGREGG